MHYTRYYTPLPVSRMNDRTLYERLRQWTAGEGVRLEREATIYALVWHDASYVRIIEVSFAPNGVAARTGLVASQYEHCTRLETDKHDMTSWHCAPYTRLEELLHELRARQLGDDPETDGLPAAEKARSGPRTPVGARQSRPR